MKRNNIILLSSVSMVFMLVFAAYGAEALKLQPQSKPGTQASVKTEKAVPGPTPLKSGNPTATKADVKTQALAPVSQTPENVYSYNPFGKPDPFLPFVEVEISTLKKTKESKSESIFPLQKAEVESFKLVGIIGDQTRRIAVVEDSAKKFYPVFVGTKIGTHDGKITDILADRITVDELDGKKTKRIVLKLRKN